MSPTIEITGGGCKEWVQFIQGKKIFRGFFQINLKAWQPQDATLGMSKDLVGSSFLFQLLS